MVSFYLLEDMYNLSFFNFVNYNKCAKCYCFYQGVEHTLNYCPLVPLYYIILLSIFKL